MPAGFLAKHKQNIAYGALLAVLLFLLRWLELRYIVFGNAFEIYAGAIAVIFTLVGIWLALKLNSPKTIVVEKEVFIDNGTGFTLNQKAVEQLRLSKRELEVLQLMAEGLSNQEIAERLFVSLNTIKTHSANLFDKLEADRRTQAIKKAKRLSLIP